MKEPYKRISLAQRIIIEKSLALGQTQTQIALAIGVHKSAVGRDIKRCKEGKYSAMDATLTAVSNSSNRRSGKCRIIQNKALGNFVFEKLDLRWSPEQIHLFLKKEYPGQPDMNISMESIYFYIYVHAKPELRKELIGQLRQKRKYRGNVRRGADKRTTIKDPVRIDERPFEVNGREIPGHWEGDLIMGKDRTSVSLRPTTSFHVRQAM